MSDEAIRLIEYLMSRRGVKTWHIVLLSEILGDKIRDLISKTYVKPLEVKVPQITYIQPKIVTRISDLRDKHVEGSLEILNVNVAGTLKELMLRSNSNEYSITFIADGVVKLSRSFKELMFMSQHIESVDVYAEVDNDGKHTGYWVLRISDVRWLNSAYIIVNVDKPLTFTHIYVKLDESII